MSFNRRVSSSEPIIDDFPVRPSTGNPEERVPNKEFQGIGKYRNEIVFSFVYFLLGCGISLYGPLYPVQARKNGLNTCIYGGVIGSSYFICILVYPLACRMASSLPSRNAVSVSVFVIGACRILFGTLMLTSDKVTFIATSFTIQAVEGIGVSILVASTILCACTSEKDQMQRTLYSIQASLCLGLILGPVVGEVVKKEFGFAVSFYIIGGLTALSFVITASLLKESEKQVTYIDIPVFYWMKDKRLLIYFFIVFASFNYIGFLSITLEFILKKFHLNILYAGLMFSVSPLAYILSAPGWIFLMRKGFNNVMLVLIGALIILGSLVLIGPVPYTVLEESLTYVSWALVLEGLGIACKCICILDALEKDLSLENKYSDIQQQLIIPTVVIFGAFLGYFCGCLTAGLTDFYIGFRKATLPLFGLEICIAICAVIFAMNRNYVSKRRRKGDTENQPILRS